MRRRTILIACCGAVALASALPGAAAFAHAPTTVALPGATLPHTYSSPPAGTSVTPVTKSPVVKLVSCTPEEHEAVYQARMAQIPDADHMGVRFTLLSQVPGKLETRVKVPALSRWRKSKPGVGTFAWKQELLNLAAGATYRVQVDFRWFDAAGAVLRKSRTRSAPCRQYSDLPNLTVKLVSSSPAAVEGMSRYRVRVENVGAATASGASLRLSVDGTVAQTQPLAALAAGESRTVPVVGPACTQWVEAAVDPDDGVVELSESDNTHSFACADFARR